MKNTLFALAALILVAACGSKQTKTVDSEAVGTDSTVTAEAADTTWAAAIDRYLIDSVGGQYAEGEYCVPAYSIVAADESRPDDILVWGDFWVFHYNQVGDTLKCVSGGSHPGLMHIRRTDNSSTATQHAGKNFAVTGFDCVEDGSGNLSSAKRIFGEHYDAFHAINSDADKREAVRREMLSDYVFKHRLSATMYQDYGQPAKRLK